MKGNGDNPLRKRSEEELSLLAKKLRLSDKMRKFAETIRADPKRNQTKAAQAAGAKHPAVQGSRWIRSQKVLDYMEVLEDKVSEVAMAQTGASVLQLAEAEGILASQARGNMGLFVDIEGEGGDSYPVFNFERAQKAGCLSLIKKLKIKSGFSPEGLPWTETDLELYDNQRAIDMFFKLHGLYKDTARPENASDALWATVLAKMPAEMLRALEQAQLRGQQAIDVPFTITAGNGDGQ